MLKRRIIPCLDVKDGRVVKGKQFQNIQDVDDPVALASFYAKEGADELVFYDITASHEKRNIIIDVVKKVSKSIHIPFTVGGGIQTIDDIASILLSGADKVSLNSGAIRCPKLIQEGATRFGNQCIVLSMDVKKVEGMYKVFLNGGRIETDLEAISWAKKAVEFGAGEIVVNSMDQDGMKQGFDIELLKQIEDAVDVPVIASGGAGSIKDFEEVALKTNVDGYLAASVFHYKEISIQTLKNKLQEQGVPIRQ
jgi:cyclase